MPRRSSFRWIVAAKFLILVLLPHLFCSEFRGNGLSLAGAAEPPTFLEFVKTQARTLRSSDAPPESLIDWKHRKKKLRQQLTEAWGGFPSEDAPLKPEILGTIQRDGYRIEKVIFQTFRDVWMTANAYVPDLPGRLPAVLCVHGHWKGAKQDPHVQARCIGLARLGFFVLAVDAFGAGERGLGKALGEYHGEMVAATLWPVGRPLSGLQVYENRRAVDYLLTRPEVDGNRLGITGASGGGNQSMYAGAFDERFKAVVPVCSVGNYQSYLGAACCMCEVVPGSLSFTEEWGVLSLTAPRGLMIISATQDAFQFSVGEARKSLAFVKPVYQLYGQPDNVKHAIFESRHDYNQPMREAMYGWMTRYLKNQGDGSPIPEPQMSTEDPEALRCFPGETRPDNWMTIPQFAARTGKRMLQDHTRPSDWRSWQASAEELRNSLDQKVLKGTTPRASQSESASTTSPETKITFEPEPGIRLTATHQIGKVPQKPATVIILSLDNEISLKQDELAQAVHNSGRSVVTLSLRATGEHAWPRDSIRRAPDHNTAEWSLILGRPLLGQWVLDLRSAISALQDNGCLNDELIVIGKGPAGVVALCAAAIDRRIDHTVTTESLASFISDVPYENQRLGIMANGIVRDVGDIAQIAALIAPERLTVCNPVSGSGETPADEEVTRILESTAHVYRLTEARGNFAIFPKLSASEIAQKLN